MSMTSDDVPLLEHKATGGNVMAQTTLGRYWLANSPLTTTSVAVEGNQQDMPMKARAWLRKASNAGFPIAQTELARLYFTCTGGPRDLKESQRLLMLAGAAHYAKARLELVSQNLK
jgi:TPR repeat protein